MTTLTGHHHISMLTKDGKKNHDFYTHILGLRRVKMTVNQDTPTMYHLFYGDLTGSPGTELTFFEMPIAGRTTRGTNAITRIGLFVRSYESLHYWKKRFENHDVQHGEITTYAGKDALHFEDHEGLRMVLLNLNSNEIPAHWQPFENNTIKREHTILGMGTTEITVKSLSSTIDLLTTIFGYTICSQSHTQALLQHEQGNVYGEIKLIEQDGPTERPGRGSIHHLALRIESEEALRELNEQLLAYGLHTSGVIDRYYFHSLYVRDHNHILFEIATDSPGFTVDSSIEELGTRLDLPPFLEPRRKEIEAALTPLD